MPSDYVSPFPDIKEQAYWNEPVIERDMPECREEIIFN